MDPVNSLRLATISVEFNLTALYFVALVFAGIVAMAARHRLRRWNTDRACRMISEAIIGYFKPMGIEVDVETYSQFEGRRFVAAISSEPIKKFRYSFIVEQSLVREVRNLTGHRIERVYWRFPLEGSAAETPPEVAEDRYLTQGKGLATGQPGYGVEEASWEQYEKAVKASEPDKPSGQP